MTSDKQSIDEMADRLSDLARRAVRAFHVPGKDAGLSPVQLIVLSHVAETPQPIGALARACGAAQNTMSEIVQRMQRRGLVEKNRSEADQRVVLVSATQQGITTLHNQRAFLRRSHRRTLEHLSPEQRKLLLDSVATVIGLLETAAQSSRKDSSQ